MREYQLCTKPSKCIIGVQSLKLLGHIVDAKGIHTDPDKCRAISQMSRPTDVRAVRRFLGASGYYRDLIPEYARLAEPLVALTVRMSHLGGLNGVPPLSLAVRISYYLITAWLIRM